MAAPRPSLAVKEATAAQMLDLRTPHFRKLVAAGALPQPFQIGDAQRWRVDELQAIVAGVAAKTHEDFEL
ncbi:hypothetical protein [Pseudooceanicola spongiae]|uniref:Uncharacterized protein n=1 Tax=Pseudooceanicola spongiae TaxID=2613965 RepID=A0A7L9WJ82_9RHOB|nr:hypothetical protein [Pseudooceanicola spongiae]QOL80451.1 hypothetical protein F3W81_06270 [Pseudooceanicola spongiae]